MRRISGVLGLLALILTATGPASANICAFDNAPAATLLFPFVAVDYNDPIGGETTLISITNTSWEAQILHVTLWTDFGEGLLNFNILLTGYDMIRFDMGEISTHRSAAGHLLGAAQRRTRASRTAAPCRRANTLTQTAPAMDPPAPPSPSATAARPPLRATPVSTRRRFLRVTSNLFQG